jgi:PST family polysaccharide transporter
MQKRLQFRRVALIDGLQSVALAGATLSLALAGFRYWSLVMASLIGGALGTTLIVASARLPYRWPRFTALRRMLTFSGQLLVARLAWFLFSDSDFLVAGKMLGTAALGTYTLAWNLAYVPMEKISTLVTGVTLSILSAAQHDLNELRRYVLLITEGLALTTFPATIGLALVANDFVPLVVGEQWRLAIPPLQMLCISAGVRSVTPVLSQVLSVLKDTRYTMWRNIAAAIVLPPSFAIATRWGINGLAATWFIVYPIFVALPLWRRSFRHLTLPALHYFAALRPATEGCLVMVCVVLSARAILFENLPPMARVTLMIMIGALSYALVLMLRWRSRLDTFRTAWQLLRR